MEETIDRLLQCCDCGSTFLFTADEQHFYRERGFSDPRRCRHCRKDRRSHREDLDGAVYRAPDSEIPIPPRARHEPRSHSRAEAQPVARARIAPAWQPPRSVELTGPPPGGQPAPEKPHGTLGLDQRSKTPRVISTDQLREWRRDRPLFEATCSRCKRTTLVPFRPAVGRPVLCRECYRVGPELELPLAATRTPAAERDEGTPESVE